MSDVVTINLGLILLIASVVAMISRRMRLPYSVGGSGAKWQNEQAQAVPLADKALAQLVEAERGQPVAVAP
jgi:hypothetical protein